MNAFELFAVLKLDKSSYEKGLSNAATAAKGFSDKAKTVMKVGTAAFAATTAAVVGLEKKLVSSTKEVASYGDVIDKESQKMGISAKAYQEWDAVLQHTGGSIGNLKPALKTLSKEIVNNSEAFQQLGISQEQLKKSSVEDVLNITIEKLQGMDNNIERTRLATQLLGRSSIELGALLNTSAKDTQEMKDRLHELGGVMSDESVKAAAAYQDQLQDMNTAISGVKRNLVSNFLPSVTTAMSGITDIVTGKTDEGIKKISEGVKKIISDISAKAPEIIEKVSEMLSQLLPDFVKLGVSLLQGIAKGIIQALPALSKSLKDVSGQIISALIEIGKTLISLLPEILPELINAIAEIAAVIANSLPEIIPQIVDALMDALEALTSPDVLSSLIESALKLIIALADGLVKSIPRLLEALPVIIQNLLTALLKFTPQIVQAGIQLFVSLVQNLPAIIAGIVQAIPQIIAAIFQAFASFGTDLGKIFSNAWEGLKKIFDPAVVGQFFSSVWNGIQNAFASVGNWFSDVFSKAWEAVKNVFSPVGEMFSNIGRSILNGLSSVINGIIWGINQVIKVPFEGLNGILSAIKSINIFGLKPFDWVGQIPIPEIPSIPMLAEGGILKRGQVALLEGQGDEAVIPLSQNTEWIDMVAQRLSGYQQADNVEMVKALQAVKIPQQQTVVTALINEDFVGQLRNTLNSATTLIVDAVKNIPVSTTYASIPETTYQGDSVNNVNTSNSTINYTYNVSVNVAEMNANSQEDIERLAETLSQIMSQQATRREVAFG